MTKPVFPAQCRGCGKCCVREDPKLDVLVEPTDRVPEHLVLEQDGLRWMRRRSDRSCIALDPRTRECTIHPVRPQGCREVDMGDPDCVAALLRR